jgi:predicted Ser/Thr protein kinase
LAVLSGLGFFVPLVDHCALNYSEAPSPLPWLSAFFNAVTGNGFATIAFFALVVLACLMADLLVLFSSLPKAPEFKVSRLKDRNERLDQLWDSILDFRRLAYANFRFTRLKEIYSPILRRTDLALTVALLSKRLINRYCNSETTTTIETKVAAESKPQVVYVDNLPLMQRLDLPERYQVLEEIGTGGMGVIFKGKHRTTGADLAIKVMHPHHSSNPSHLLRFEQEARTATTLHHPNIVVVHDFGVTERSIAFLVMEWLNGLNLEMVMKQSGKLSLNRFVHIFEQCAAALSHSHKKGIIHRDVKPSNIILMSTETATDFVKIVDFGIAKVLTSDDEDTLQLTQTGEVLGSPKFMSPEQCMGKPMDYRSDIYSLGCVMYEAIVGVPPLSAENQAQMFYRHMFHMPARPSLINPDLELPDLVEPILFRTLQKDPEKRYNSMEELHNALNQIKTHTSVKCPLT